VLLSLVRPDDGYTEDRIKKMIAAGGESDIQFPTFIPVNLTYQTAFVDDAGKLQFRDDVYGRDRTLLAMLKSEDRKSLDVAIEHPIDISHREVLAIPDQPSLFGGRSLFGGGGNSYYPNRGGYSGDGFFLAAVRRLCLRAAADPQEARKPPERDPVRQYGRALTPSVNHSFSAPGGKNPLRPEFGPFSPHCNVSHIPGRGWGDGTFSLALPKLNRALALFGAAGSRDG
jgi:hypothetical protein